MSSLQGFAYVCTHISGLCGLRGSNWPITQSCECEYIPFLLENNTINEW